MKKFNAEQIRTFLTALDKQLDEHLDLILRRFLYFTVLISLSVSLDSCGGCGGMNGSEKDGDDAGAEGMEDEPLSCPESDDCDQPPALSITEPENGAAVYGDVPVKVDVYDDTGVDLVKISVDGEVIMEDESAPFSGIWRTDAFAQGPHVLSAVAIDTAGQESPEDSINVFIDRTPPTVSILEPANEAKVAATVQVTAQAADNIGVEEVLFEAAASGFFQSHNDNTQPYEWTLEIDSLYSGEAITISASAIDLAGWTASRHITVKYCPPETCNGIDDDCNGIIDDITVPQPLAPKNGERVQMQVPLFTWLESTGVCGTPFYEIQVDDACTTPGFDSCAFPDPEIDTSGISDTSFRPSSELPVSPDPPVGRRYYWRVRACDDSQCSSWSPVRYIDIGKVPIDFNGDGFNDTVVGAPKQDVLYYNEGNVYVYYGSSSGIPINPSLSLNNSDIRITGNFGNSVASAGDLNGDGFSDLVVGAPFQDAGATDEGNVFIYYGSPAGISDDPSLSLDNPENQVDGEFGYSVI